MHTTLAKVSICKKKNEFEKLQCKLCFGENTAVDVKHIKIFTMATDLWLKGYS